MNYSETIERELSKLLKDRVIAHRARFIEIFKARYMEMLPSLIKYDNASKTNIDFMKVEIALRNGYDIVIGETATDETLQVIGFATSKQTSENPANLFKDTHLRHGDISFIIPEWRQLQYYEEISNNDDCQTGNFAVLRNKNINYVSDHAIIDHYIKELAEIVLSRFSISMQIKISTIFMGDPGDETLQEMISEIYNGNPFVKMSDLFDPEEQIYHMKNEGIASNFQELKREYQNKISELNNALGIQSLAVEKSSGVSDEEAKSNRGFTTSNSNIYLDGRNHGLKKLNKRYGLNMEAMYNDEVTSEFTLMAEDETDDEGGDGDDNNDTV